MTLRILLVSALVLVVGLAAWQSALEAQQKPRISVTVSDQTGGMNIHVVQDAGIVFLLPDLPETVQICTEFRGGGYTNCRSVKELRLPAK